jgi:hypothetical protein
VSLAADFAEAVGGSLAHVTAASNLPGIKSEGLRSARDLAEAAGVALSDLELRSNRLAVGKALLNHQKPFRAGLRAASNVLDGHTPKTWSAQLDQRIFFWPDGAQDRFQASIDADVPTTVIRIDALAFAEAVEDHIDLCALNSGSFRQISADPARKTGVRGDWIYRPLSEGIGAFRSYRRNKGLVKSLDCIREVSLRCPLPPGVLDALRL